MKYQKEILRIIDNVPEFNIIKEFNYDAHNISKLVKKVYSYDYAPFHHLKSKTEYLKKTQSKVKFIFIRNEKPVENYFGSGRFLHIECEKIKKIKELIRDKYNERKEDRRTENHVVHASDNESQTDYILKYLGYRNGIKTFDKNVNKIINFPYHLNIPDNYSIKKIDINDLLCSIIKNGKRTVVSIESSPQYKGGKYYKEYLKNYNGKYIQDGYSVEKYNQLCENMEYLKGVHSIDYIITKKIHDKLLVLDGLHRAAIQKKNGCKTVKVIIV